MQEQYDELESRFDALTKEETEKNQKIRAKIHELRDLEGVESANRMLESKLENLQSALEIKEEENKRLRSIYEGGKEFEARQRDVFRQIESSNPQELGAPLEITDEMQYLSHVQQKIQDFGINYPTRLLYAFHTALKSATYAPLSVLLGVSGTGKSELPKLYAHFGGFNFLAQAVQPTWDSPESMMGYFNMIENKFDSTEILRFFVQTAHSQREQNFGLQESMNLILLDEMNLAHIELYFAEFLSKLEQKRSDKEGVFVHVKLGTGMPWQILLGDNLLWVGTMNEDESTKALSDKVLDRAFCLNFPRPAKLHSRKTGLSISRQDFKYLRRSIWQTWLRDEQIPTQALENYKELVEQINRLLEKTGRAIGHRVWQGMEFYMKNHPLVSVHQEDSNLLNQALRFAFEEQVVQKIVPKLRGMEIEGDTKEVLVKIQECLNKQNMQLKVDFQNAMNNPYRQFIFNSAHYLDNLEWQALLDKTQK